MQVQPINNSNSQTFGALNLTSAAKTLIEQEKGGKAGRVGKAGSDSHLHKFSPYKYYIFKLSIPYLNH